MDKTNKKETCKGCPFIEESNSIGRLFKCTVWNKIISPSVTDACLYKGYKKGGLK